MSIDRVIRHPNGGGQKVGLEVHVSEDSFCDKDSLIKGRSGIFGSSLIRSAVRDTTIVDSKLVQTILVDCIAHNASVSLVYLSEVVVEDAHLLGPWELEGNARISCGVWHRAPRFKRIMGENGVDVGLTESTDSHALMACWRKPITKWLAFGPRLGRKHRWTSLQIDEAKDFFTELLDCPLEGVS
jgi:hypothetical protein